MCGKSIDARSVRVAILLGVLAAVVLALFGLHWPLQPGFNVCPLYRFTAVPCLGCGMTRSILSLLRGNFGAAVEYHPFGPVLAVAVAIGLALRLLYAGAARMPGEAAVMRVYHLALAGVMGAFAVFGLWRMIVVILFD